MPVQPLTVNLPEPIFTKLQERARQSKRSVEAEVAEVVAAAVPAGEALPADLQAELSSLSLLDDDALWRAARTRLPDADASELEELHFKKAREGLTEPESERLASLVRHYERSMLVRGRAAALLKQRGHDVTPLM